jgi:hypothetical protein
MGRRVFTVLAALSFTSISASQELNFGPLPFPKVSTDTWVLIEIWPEAKDMTLSAYFIERTNARNQKLCDIAKSALDNEANRMAEARGTKPSAYKTCLTIRDAIKAGYVAHGEV